MMMYGALVVAVRYYWGRVLGWFTKHWKYVTTFAAGAVAVTLVVLKRRKDVADPMADAAVAARRNLAVLAKRYDQATAASKELGRQDKALEKLAEDLAIQVEIHKAAIVELSAGKAYDWDNMSDEEIDEKFKAAGL